MIIDPYIKAHGIPENDNVSMDAVAGLLNDLAGTAIDFRGVRAARQPRSRARPGKVIQQPGDRIHGHIVILRDAVCLDVGIDDHQADLVFRDRCRDVLREVALDHLADPPAERHQFPGGASRRREEEPTVEFISGNAVMQPRGEHAPTQFMRIVFQRDDQHARALENMLAGQVAAARERERLQGAQRGFSDASGAEQRRQQTAAETHSEQPATRRRFFKIAASVPDSEPSRCRWAVWLRRLVGRLGALARLAWRRMRSSSASISGFTRVAPEQENNSSSISRKRLATISRSMTLLICAVDSSARRR